MKRFTRKDEFGNYIIGELNDLGFELEYDELNLVTKSINKLGKLEDLEEKLGMDLEKLQEAVEKAKKYDEKETAMKPNNFDKEYFMYNCPNCSKVNATFKFSYCPECGQKLDWN